jgi:hypothetical protein
MSPPLGFILFFVSLFVIGGGDTEQIFFLAQNVSPIIRKHARLEPAVPMLEGA